MKVDECELRRLRKVPEWLKHKIDEKYVESRVEKTPDGMLELVITVGGRDVVRRMAKYRPETAEEWTEMSDLLELDHYMNWMRRFCESLGEICDENTEKALEKSDVPLRKRRKTRMNGIKRMATYLAYRCLHPKTFVGKVVYYALPIVVGYTIAKVF